MTSEGKSSGAGRAIKAPARKSPPKRRGGIGDLLRLDSEQSARLLLIGVVSLVILIATGFIAFGYYYTVIRPRNRTVLQVDSTKISYEAIKRRMAYEYFQNVNYQQNSQLLPAGTFQKLLDELTKVNRADSSLGIKVTPEEFDQKFRTRIGTTTQADTKTVADAFKVALQASGLNETEYRRIIMAELIDQKITDKYKLEAPANEAQVKLEVIQTATEADARAAIARITAGEDFATVAKAVSKESNVQTTAGVHPYALKGTLNSAWEDYAWTADVGKLSDPIAAKSPSTAFYVLEVVDRSDQPVSDSEKSTIATQKENEWLKKTQDEMQASGAFKSDFSTKAQNDALNSVGARIVPKARSTQVAQQRQQISQATAIAALTAHPSTAVNVITVTSGDAATPAPATTPASGQSSNTPAAPGQPVAPGSNGP